MNRDLVLKTAERAMWGTPTLEDLQALDAEIRVAATSSGRTIQETADLLRSEALAGDHYRGAPFDQ